MALIYALISILQDRISFDIIPDLQDFTFKRYTMLSKKPFYLFSILIFAFFSFSFQSYSKEGYVPVEHGKLFYKEIGTGEPILVVHGGPGLDHSYLQPQLSALLSDNRAIFYDQRGSGKSFHSKDDLNHITIDQFVEDLEKIRTEFGFNKVILLGHSWGGLLIMHYAVQYPDHVKKLILLSSAPADSAGHKSFIETLMAKTDGFKKEINPLFSYEEMKKLNGKEINNLYRKLFSVYFFKPKQVNDLTLSFTSNYTESGFQVFQKMLQTKWYTEESSLFPDLKKLGIPTLVIHGKQDVIPFWTAEKTAKSIKNSKMVTLENCGHFPYIETPEQLKKAIGEFIK